MTEFFARKKDKLMGELRTDLAESEKFLRATADQAGEGTAGIRSRVLAGVDHTKAELKHLQKAAAEKACAAGQSADHFVGDNPWKSIGLAAGIGFLAGLLISRR